MIYVDTNYWIYWFDRRLPEHEHVKGVIRKAVQEGIIMNFVTLMEIAHFFRHLPAEEFDEKLGRIQNLESLKLRALDEELAKASLKYLANYSKVGIGGRDCVVLATMDAAGTRRIATHDEVFKKIPGLSVIDPIPRKS